MRWTVGPKQRLDAYPFRPSRLRSQLRLPPSFGEQQGRLDQVTYLASYADYLGCRSILVERHYIDRDYIEDHGLFYSRSLFPYDNYCQRVHFFKTPAPTTRHRFAEAVRSAASGRDAFDEACSEFSQEAYLGFSVIKPLKGSPVGRTVLRTFDEKTPDRRRRIFTSRTYTVHLNGVVLTVRGLPFQEQDVGVSACATTAIWCALQKVQESESLASATPAQISTLASRFTLPHGRVMPADEGLSIDQMCQAVQALGVSPTLLAATDYANTRSYLYSALRSGMAPIVIMQHEKDSASFHAVAAVGMRLLSIPEAFSTPGIEDASGTLEAIYVHDDRTGPYLRANLARRQDGLLKLDLLRRRKPERRDPWWVTHILVPSHPKIRLSFPFLRNRALELSGWVHQACELLFEGHVRTAEPVRFETWVTRAHHYIEQLYFDDGLANSSSVRSLVEDIAFPRYVGVIRLATRKLGIIDVLVDTTSTSRNPHYVAVLPLRPGHRRNLGASLISQVCDSAPLVL